MNRYAAVFAAALAVSGVPAAAAPAPAPAAQPSAIEARAKEWLHRIATGDIDRGQLTPQMNAQLTDAMIKQIASQVAPLGEPVTFRQIRSGAANGSNYYVYLVTFPSGDKWNYLFVVDRASNKISGLRISPAP